MDEWRTNDTPMVAFLRAMGMEPDRTAYDNNAVYWYFNDGPDLQDHVDAYLQGDARVEPKNYYRCMARTKDDVFDALRAAGVMRPRS